MPITSKNIPHNLQKNLDILQLEEKIKLLSQEVYGNSNIFENKLAEILENPNKGCRLLTSISKNPENIGKFAGVKAFGIRTQARKNAEGNFWLLYDSLENFVRLAQKTLDKTICDQTQQKDIQHGTKQKLTVGKKLQHTKSEQKHARSRSTSVYNLPNKGIKL